MSWFIWSTTLTVDQIDNRVVFVEWENESFSVIPQEWLPNDVQEGDTVTLSLKPTVRSNCVMRFLVLALGVNESLFAEHGLGL